MKTDGPPTAFAWRGRPALAGHGATRSKGRRRGAGRHRVLASLLDAGTVAALTSGLLVLVLRLWAASPKVPFSYAGPWSQKFFSGDATFHLMVARALQQGQWWWSPNPNLGAPLGQDLRDFPLGPDHLHLIILKGLVALLGDPFAAVNAYYVLGYVLVALSAWGVLRMLGISRPIAVVVGVLFTFLPYHAGKGPEQLFLAAYFSVPLGVLLLHWHLTGRTAWGPGRRPDVPGLTGRRLAAVLVVAAVLGSSSAYYGLYFLVLLGLTAALQLLARRDWRPMLSAALLGVPVLATLVLNAAPALVYTARNGPNTGLARTPDQTWFFGLKPSQLLMPIEDHRVGLLAALARAQRAASGWQEPGNSLGALGSLTAIALGVVLVRRLAAGWPAASVRARFRERQAALAVLAMLVATAGGGSLLIALVGLGEARVWARMSIYIAFFVLCALASWLDDALDRVRNWRRSRLTWAVWPALAVLLLGGVWDQTSPAGVPAYAPARAAFDSDNAFMAKARNLLGDGAAIWQLPLVSFPEGGLRFFAMYDYDEFKGYLHAPELRWSYGALKSRQAANWQLAVTGQPLAEQLPLVAAAGFTGVYVDSFGLPDRGGVLLEQMQGLLGQQPLRSDDGRLALFDLRPFAQRLQGRLGQAVLQATADNLLKPTYRQRFGQGFLSAGVDDLDGQWAAGPQAELTLVNSTGQPVEVWLGLVARSALPGTYRLRLQGSGTDQAVDITEVGQRVRRRIVLPPGDTQLRLTTDAPEQVLPLGNRTFYVGSLLVLGPKAQEVLRSCAPLPPATLARC